MNWKDILIIVVLVSVVGGLFAYEYWWKPEEETKGPELPKITEEEKEELVSPKLEDEWQYFKVEKYGLSMKIPADYKKTDFIELDPKESKMLLVANFNRNGNEGFVLSIVNEGEQYVKESKETYQLEFERKESLIGLPFVAGAKIINIQKIEKKECQIFIFSSEKDDRTFNKLVFIFPAYREDLILKMGFDYPSKDREEIISKTINSIECSSAIETGEWCPIGTYANFGGSDQYKITGIERHKVAGKYMDLCCGERTATGGVGKGKKCIDMPTGDYNYLIMWVASERTSWQYEKLTEVYPKDGQRCMISFEGGKEIGTMCLPKE